MIKPSQFTYFRNWYGYQLFEVDRIVIFFLSLHGSRVHVGQQFLLSRLRPRVQNCFRNQTFIFWKWHKKSILSCSKFMQTVTIWTRFWVIGHMCLPIDALSWLFELISFSNLLPRNSPQWWIILQQKFWNFFEGNFILKLLL